MSIQKAFLRIFVLQVSRSCGRRWRRGTRACEANLRLKKSIQRRSSAHFPDTRTKIVLHGLFETFREHQWNLREHSQRDRLTKLQELRLADPGVYKNQKIDPASIMAALSRTEAGFLVSTVDFPSVRNLETEPE